MKGNRAKGKKLFFKKELLIAFVETNSGDQDSRDLVGIHVGGWSSVLEIALFVLRNLAWDANGRTTMRHRVAELVPTSSLVAASQTALVIEAPCD